MAASDSRCPLERKVLIQTLDEIVQILAKDARGRMSCESDCVQPRRAGAATSLSRVAACRETAVVPYVGDAGASSSSAPGAALEACKSSELRAGVFYSECRCLKRDGLQRTCRRAGCGDRCGLARPARRTPAPLGTPVEALVLQPLCCPGRKERQRLEYLHEKADLLKRPPPPPPPEPQPLPPPPAYNWRGTFEHRCAPDSRCPRRRAAVQYPCGGARCRHWAVPKPCTLPVCRADCFEHPPGWPTFAR